MGSILARKLGWRGTGKGELALSSDKLAVRPVYGQFVPQGPDADPKNFSRLGSVSANLGDLGAAACLAIKILVTQAAVTAISNVHC